MNSRGSPCRVCALNQSLLASCFKDTHHIKVYTHKQDSETYDMLHYINLRLQRERRLIPAEFWKNKIKTLDCRPRKFVSCFSPLRHTTLTTARVAWNGLIFNMLWGTDPRVEPWGKIECLPFFQYLSKCCPTWLFCVSRIENRKISQSVCIVFFFPTFFFFFLWVLPVWPDARFRNVWCRCVLI